MAPDHREGAWQPVISGLHEAVWQLQSPDDSASLLDRVREALVELGVLCDSCVAYLVRDSDSATVVQRRLVGPAGHWHQMPADEERQAIVDTWHERAVVSRIAGPPSPDGAGTTRHSCCGHPVGALLEAPFSHGVLGLYREDRTPFTASDVDAAEQATLVLSGLYHRVDDLESLNAKERQLRQVQRLQLVGQLAAEVAHEINNPLSVVIGECDMLLDGILDPELEESIRAISLGGQQAQAVSNRLLEFIRGHKAEKEWINFNRLVQESLVLMRRLLRKEGVELEENLGRNLPWIEAHAGQVQQVVLNLVQNSRDALSGYRVQGLVRVRTYARNGHVILEVDDNGPGIPQEIRTRIFEPFFTTKSNGQRTGLGLSVCAGIAQEHGGTLRLEPRVLGTCMVLELPVRQHGPTSPN